VSKSELPIAIIGAGPVGLAAAAQAASRDGNAIVFEAGTTIGASVLRWGHVRVFSPWKYNIDAAARALLEAEGWDAPDGDEYPTGRELVEQYLRPLSRTRAIASHLHLNHRVTAVTRLGFDKMKTTGREDAPFALTVATPTGERQILARAVIDTSGTYTLPNPIGASGTFAGGEAAAAARIFYGIPDVLGAARARYTGRRVLVVGAGHSAFDVLIDLAALAEREPREPMTITWVVRRPFVDSKYGGASNDALPARGALGSRMRALVDRGIVRQEILGISTVRVTDEGVFVSDDHRELGAFDEVVAVTGFRPDLAPLRELRVRVDEILEAPPALAPLIDPNHHSCGTVPPHGARELAHPEKDFYIAGMKSYGRAPTFLMLTGYEQVRSIVAALVGDTAGAAQVQLVLPQTGVCSGGPGSDCCDETTNDCGSPKSTCCSTSEFIPLSAMTESA
jgi:thioredoxin reductase